MISYTEQIDAAMEAKTLSRDGEPRWVVEYQRIEEPYVVTNRCPLFGYVRKWMFVGGVQV